MINTSFNFRTQGFEGVGTSSRMLGERVHKSFFLSSSLGAVFHTTNAYSEFHCESVGSE